MAMIPSLAPFMEIPTGLFPTGHAGVGAPINRATSLSGLGEYPGYYCYDKNRPTWLPYVIDSVSESICKWSPSTVAGNIKACATGDASCGDPTEAQADPNVSGAGIAKPGEKTNVPTCTGLYELDQASNTCKLNLLSTPVLMGAGLLTVLVVFAFSAGRR